MKGNIPEEQQEQESRLIINSAPIIIFYKDKDGKFLRVNKAFAEALQMPEEEFAGKTVFDLYSDKIAEAMTADDHEVFKSRKPKLNIIEQYESASGTRWVQTDKIPTFGKDGSISGLIGFAQDITERMQAEEALRQSEERYRTILTEIQDAYFEVDIAGNFTFGNDSFYQYLGYSPGELIGVNYRVTTAADAVEKVYKGFNQVYRTGIPINDLAYKTVRKDGSTGYVEIAVNLIRNEKGEITSFRCVGRDISQRTQLEEELRRSEERYRTILEEMQDGYFEVDLAGNCTFANEANCRNLGYPREELIGMNYRAYIATEGVDELYKAFNQVYLTGQPSKAIIFKIIQKDGSLGQGEISAFPLRNERGEIIGFRGIGRDVTERVQMEETLRRSEEKYRTLLDEMEEGYYEDDLAGNFTFFNDSICHMLGYPRKEMIGMNYRAYTDTEDVDKVHKAFNQVYRTGKPIRNMQYTTIRKDGSKRFAETSVFPANSSSGI